jgi:hypothetical protein
MNSMHFFVAPKPGIQKDVFKNATFSGKSTAVETESAPGFSWTSGQEKPYTAPFSMKWEGLINIPKTGIYKFVLESDDGSWLYIDDQEIIDNGGEHAKTRSAGLVQISEGFHKLRIKYFDVGGEALLKLYWTPPGQTEEAVPTSSFAH